MSQHDMDVINAAGATVRADINLALKALASFNNGVIPPATTFAYQMYVDTSTLPGANAIIYIRAGDNLSWKRWGYVDKDTDQLIPDLTTEAVGFASGVKMIFYADVAPTGWTLLNTLDDKILYITKGSAAGGQTGGAAHTTGTWTQPNHTHTGPSHTHTGPSHTHTGPSHTHTHSHGKGGYLLDGLATTADGVSTDTNALASGTDATGASGTDATGASGTAATGTSATVNTWRPSAYCSIICAKN